MARVENYCPSYGYSSCDTNNKTLRRVCQVHPLRRLTPRPRSRPARSRTPATVFPRRMILESWPVPTLATTATQLVMTRRFSISPRRRHESLRSSFTTTPPRVTLRRVSARRETRLRRARRDGNGDASLPSAGSGPTRLHHRRARPRRLDVVGRGRSGESPRTNRRCHCPRRRGTTGTVTR